IILIARNELLRCRSRRSPEIIQFAVSGCCDHQRPIFGSDAVIRCYHTGLTVTQKLGTVYKVQNCPIRAKLEDEAAPRPLDLRILKAASAAQDGGNLRQRGEFLRQLCGCENRRATALNPRFGERDHFDHALIAFARGGAEGEDPMFVQNKPLNLWLGIEY